MEMKRILATERVSLDPHAAQHEALAALKNAARERKI
jgi:hypothetical protein